MVSVIHIHNTVIIYYKSVGGKALKVEYDLQGKSKSYLILSDEFLNANKAISEMQVCFTSKKVISYGTCFKNLDFRYVVLSSTDLSNAKKYISRNIKKFINGYRIKHCTH